MCSVCVSIVSVVFNNCFRWEVKHVVSFIDGAEQLIVHIEELFCLVAFCNPALAFAVPIDQEIVVVAIGAGQSTVIA